MGLLVSVSGIFSVAGNSWIYLYSQNTNGGSARFRCVDLEIGTNSGFNANEKGYRGGNTLLSSNPTGYGPGASVGGANGNGGAGCGGNGGSGSDGSMPGGAAYGSYTNPVDPGSGSGGAQSGGWGDGKYGGGLVHIEAVDSVLVDGSVLANGNGSSYMGGGSGGAINIKCKTFRGSGLLAAVGGNDMRSDWRNGGAGGGGRIAVIFNPAAQAAFAVPAYGLFNAAGGTMGVSDTSVSRVRAALGRPGSLYFTTNTFFDLARVQGGTVRIPGVTSLAMNSLSLDTGIVAFPSGFSLTVYPRRDHHGRGGTRHEQLRGDHWPRPYRELGLPQGKCIFPGWSGPKDPRRRSPPLPMVAWTYTARGQPITFRCWSEGMSR